MNGEYSSYIRKFKITKPGEIDYQISDERKTSPIVLKRNSYINYDDCEPINEFKRQANITVSPKPHTFNNDKRINPANNVTNMKYSSLTMKWPSEQKVNIDRLRAHSHCDQKRSPLPPKPVKPQHDFMRNSNSDNILPHSNQSTVSSSIPNSDIVRLRPNTENISGLMSSSNAVDQLRAVELMRDMEFQGLGLVTALDRFVQKIPVIGESQERERILQHFTRRYMECNIQAYKDIDSCHTLVCALMLLNTDLHGQMTSKRMTSVEFVNNIITSFPDHNYDPAELEQMYIYLKKHGLKLDNVKNAKFRRRISDLLRFTSWSTPPSKTPVTIDADTKWQRRFISGNIWRQCIYRAQKQKPPVGHRGWKLQFVSVVGLQMLLFKTNLNEEQRRDTCRQFMETSSNRPNAEDSPRGAVASLLGSDDDLLTTADRNSLANSTVSSSNDGVFNDVGSACLSGLAMAPPSPYERHVSTASRGATPSEHPGEENGFTEHDVQHCLRIGHAYAQVRSSTSDRSKSSCFRLRLADESTYLFDVGKEQCQLWVDRINYAAALLSAPPVAGVGHADHYKPMLPPRFTDLSLEEQIDSHTNQFRLYSNSLRNLQQSPQATTTAVLSQIKYTEQSLVRFQTYVEILQRQPEPVCSPGLGSRGVSGSVTSVSLASTVQHMRPATDCTLRRNIRGRPNHQSTPWSRTPDSLLTLVSDPSQQAVPRHQLESSASRQRAESLSRNPHPFSSLPPQYRPAEQFSRFVDPSFILQPPPPRYSPPQPRRYRP